MYNYRGTMYLLFKLGSGLALPKESIVTNIFVFFLIFSHIGLELALSHKENV